MSEIPMYVTHYHGLENIPYHRAQQWIEVFEKALVDEPDNIAHHLSSALGLLRVEQNEDAAAELKIVVDKGDERERGLAERLLGRMSG